MVKMVNGDPNWIVRNYCQINPRQLLNTYLLLLVICGTTTEWLHAASAGRL